MTTTNTTAPKKASKSAAIVPIATPAKKTATAKEPAPAVKASKKASKALGIVAPATPDDLAALGLASEPEPAPVPSAKKKTAAQIRAEKDAKLFADLEKSNQAIEASKKVIAAFGPEGKTPLTDGEIAVLDEVLHADITNGDPSNGVWSVGLADGINLPAKSVPGIVASLAKKGLVTTYDDKDPKESTVTPTPAGLALFGYNAEGKKAGALNGFKTREQAAEPADPAVVKPTGFDPNKYLQCKDGWRYLVCKIQEETVDGKVLYSEWIKTTITSTIYNFSWGQAWVAPKPKADRAKRIDIAWINDGQVYVYVDENYDEKWIVSLSDFCKWIKEVGAKLANA